MANCILHERRFERGRGVDAAIFGYLGPILLHLQYKHAAEVEKWADVFVPNEEKLRAQGTG